MALKRKRIVILASGSGTGFAALADAVSKGTVPNAEVVGLVCNNPEAFVILRAKERGIPVFVVNSKSFKVDGKLDRPAYEEVLSEILQTLNPDLICLAGYLLLMGKTLIARWPGKIINIHPSLLPKFKGLHALRQALKAGEKETGCTVHFVTEELDAGPILLQTKIPVLPKDTEESLAERLRPFEHATYVSVLKKLCS